jgi:hypothetical protein
VILSSSWNSVVQPSSTRTAKYDSRNAGAARTSTGSSYRTEGRF